MHFSLCYPASSYVCNNCNGNVQCQRFCALHTTNSPLATTPITTTWKKYTNPSKPSWWSPLPCELCFGWSRNQNATIRKHCQWGCGKPPKVHTTVIRETTHPLKTTTWKKYTNPSKPSWWSPLPCELCFGWSRNQNATIRKHCQWGCGKPPKVHTTVSTAMTASNTQTESTPWKPQKNEQRLAFGDYIKLHTRYIWLLIGVVGVGFIATSVVVISKFSSRKRRVGVVLQNSSNAVVCTGNPFVV